MHKKVKFIEVDSELGAGTRGASMGIDALKIASLNKKSYLFSETSSVKVQTYNEKLWDNPLDFPNGKYINGIKKVLENVCSHVSNELTENFPIVLAGDHSSAAGTICGIKNKYFDKTLGVIWIDAHADLHSPYTSPSGNMHGMPLAIALAEDNIENKVNEPYPKTLEYWNELKNIGIKGPKFSPENLVFITVRDTETPEKNLISKHNIKNFSYQEVKEKGINKIVDETFTKLQNCDIIYVSFDVDSMDSTYSVGTGTPVPNGLTPEEAIELNTQLVTNEKVVCWEMVEVNPTLDTKNKMAENAFNVLESVVNQLNKQ